MDQFDGSGPADDPRDDKKDRDAKRHQTDAAPAMAAPLPNRWHVPLVRARTIQEAPELPVRVPGDPERDERGPRQDGRGSPQQFFANPTRHAFSRMQKEP